MSSTPPSADKDRDRTPKKKTGRKRGGQEGHKGSSLSYTEHPDRIEKITADNCDFCGHSLSAYPVTIATHQVIDIEFTKVVTEYQIERKFCPCGNHQNDHLCLAPVTYGAAVKAKSVELQQIHCLAIRRCALFFQKNFAITLSPATIQAFSKKAFDRLELWEKSVKEELLNSDLIHADETGININGKNWWVHVLSTPRLTIMFPHLKRGKKAILEGEVLPFYKGFLCHDFWSSYKNFDAIHIACNAHLLRELNKVTEKYKQRWAKKLSKLLIQANQEKERSEAGLEHSRIVYFENKYDKLIKEGLIQNPRNTERISRRGRIPQTYPRCLLERFVDHKSSILMFMYDPRVPFTNNAAERDIRMLKVQQKVSGCFRTEEGAKYHCRIRSYVLTMEKQGISAHQALEDLFRET